RRLKRHRVLATTAAAAGLVALTCLAVMTSVLRVAYSRESLARAVAEGQRARADANFQTGALFANKAAERFHQLGHNEEAVAWQDRLIDWLETALRDDPQNPRIRLALRHCLETRALSSFQLQRHADALESWDRRLRLDPVPLPHEQRVWR